MEGRESREVERNLYLVAVGFESREQMWGPFETSVNIVFHALYVHDGEEE